MNECKINTNVIFGAGSISCLKEYKNLNVTIVTDPFLRDCGATVNLEMLLSDCNTALYWDIKPDPTLSQVSATYQFVLENKTDIIVAFGGGSAIDTAKAVILVNSQAGGKPIRLVAIPTTAGTGSEVTNYTVVKDDATGRKFPLMDDVMQPERAILDYTLTKTVPQSVTAATGMDVITHALEAYVAKNASPITDAFAEKALSLAFANLYNAYKDGNNDEARENMLMASYLAGLAFNSAGLGACHSIAHNLGALFHIPHGKANAIALPYVVAHNASLDVPFGTDKSEPAKKLAKISEIIGLPAGGVRLSVLNLVNQIKSLNQKMGLPLNLAQNGIKREEYLAVRDELIDGTLSDGCLPLNPVEFTRDAMAKLIDKIYG